jgi:flagellar export protein FliJ
MNTTWTVLAEKAQSAAREAQAQVHAVREQMEKLDVSLAHVDRLRDDYIARYNETQKIAHSIQDTITYRKFLEHLRGLRRKVEAQREQVNLALAEAKHAHVLALREQAKMEAMVEREVRNRALEVARLEQRALDEAGLRLFNMR